MSSFRASVLAAQVLSCGIALSCGGSREPQCILLITLDTTRADRLGCYGYDGAATPNLDRLAAEGVLFRQAQAPVPITFPSHATMFTGNYPPVHGIRYNGMFRLDESSVTLAEILRDAGWSTAGVPAAFPMTASTGIGQGFEVYRDMFQGSGPPEAGAKELPLDAERSASDTSGLGIELLREAGERRFFLWLHYWAPHLPYDPPFPFSARYRDRPYDGEIAYADQELGRLFDALREMGLWERTLVVVVGDHGEGLYDHNEKMHANLVYQSTLHVPLIVKPPGPVRPGVVEEAVSLADIAPTLLDFAGVDGPEMEGVSLEPAVYGRDPPRRSIYFESLAGSLVYGWSPLEGLRRGAWKYIRSPSPELFDLEDDPSEMGNLYQTHRDRAAEMERELLELERQWSEGGTTATATPTPLDQATLERLASLGYVGGFVTEERREGPDPKDLVHLELDTFAARNQMRGKDYTGALERLEGVLAADPTNRHALRMAASAAFLGGEPDRALGFTERALELYPEFVPARILHGEVFVSKGEVDRAAEVFRAGLEYHPHDTGLNYRLAVALYALDRPREAEEIVDRIIGRGVGGELPAFLVLRASCLAKLGDGEAALQVLRQAIERGYRGREVLEQEPLLGVLRAVPGFDEVLRAIPGS